MFAMVVGAAVALFLIGLPLAIIGLFIMSVLDRVRSSPEHRSRAAESEPGGTAPHLMISSARSNAAPASARNRPYASLLPPSGFR
jgi:hypothetical protein